MFAKTKILGVALATFVAVSLTACGSGEEKETRVPSSELKAEAKGGKLLAVPKSYVREKKTDTPPPFIVLMGEERDESIPRYSLLSSAFILEKNGDEILSIKATNKKGEDCGARYDTIKQSGIVSGMGEIKCDYKEVAVIEATTKSSGKVSYKF